MTEDKEQTEMNTMTDLLRSLRPASNQHDPRRVFYEAGLNAAKSELAAQRRSTLALIAVAASLLGIIVTAPLSFVAGNRVALQREAETPIGLDDKVRANGSGGQLDRSTQAIVNHDSVTPSDPNLDTLAADATEIATVDKDAESNRSKVSDEERMLDEVRDSLLAGVSLSEWMNRFAVFNRSPDGVTSGNDQLRVIDGAALRPEDIEREEMDWPLISRLAMSSGVSNGTSKQLDPAIPIRVGDLTTFSKIWEIAK